MGKSSDKDIASKADTTLIDKSKNLPNSKSRKYSDTINYTKNKKDIIDDNLNRHENNRSQYYKNSNIKERYTRNRDFKNDRRTANRPATYDVSPIHRSRERLNSKNEIKSNSITCKKIEERIENKSSDKINKFYENEEDTGEIWLKEKGRFDQTEFSINDRFSALSISSAPLKVEDNISVEIERNIRGKEPFRIPRRVDHSLVDIVRQPADDTRFLMTRETFDVFKDLIDLDKRTIKLHEKIDDSNFYLPLDYSKIEKRRVNLNQNEDRLSRRNLKNSPNEQNVRTPSEDRTDRRRQNADNPIRRENRYGNNYGNSRIGGRGNRYTDRKSDRRMSAGKDTRHETRGDEFRGMRSQGINTNSRNVDLRQDRQLDWRSNNKSSVKDRLGTKVDEGDDQPIVKIMRLQADGEITEFDKGLNNTLPDFSKRPGKYTYDAWKNKPELIPRGASYFEHDTREDDDWQPRGMRRGGRYGSGNQRTRGRFNRPYNNPRRNPESFDAWKHDKFEELQDNSLTSTTEK